MELSRHRLKRASLSIQVFWHIHAPLPPSPLLNRSDCALPAFPGVTLLTALLAKEQCIALSEADTACAFLGLNMVCFLQREGLCHSTWLWSPCLDYVSLNLSGELHGVPSATIFHPEGKDESHLGWRRSVAVMQERSKFCPFTL